MTYHYGILAAEMGVGKSLAAIEIIERSGSEEFWWVGPRSALVAVDEEFEKWSLTTKLNLMTYEGLVKIMKEWAPGTPAPRGVIFDESQRLKGETSQRTLAAQALTDAIRAEYGYDGYVVCLTGTPSPKSPLDWWAPCLAGETWILTTKGPRQISDLLESPIETHVKDTDYPCSNFYLTGRKELFLLETEEGYSVKSTSNHRFQRDAGDWCELQDLNQGDKIKLANHKDFGWPGELTFEDGWALGFLVGDGTVYETDGKLYGRIHFYSFKTKLIQVMETYFPGASATKDCIQFKHLNHLIREFGFSKKKQITKAFESRISSRCMKGFLRGFFDADGSVDYNRLCVTLTQTNKERIQTAQRMLSYFGIRSRIQVRRRNESARYIEGRRIFSNDIHYVLHIIGDDVITFQQAVGFNHPDKSELLIEKIGCRHHFTQTDTATVSSISSCGVADTFDATVTEAHCFAANGLLAHNCEICWPGFLREGSRNQLKYRLGLHQTKAKRDGFYYERVTWLDDERKCANCGGYPKGTEDAVICVCGKYARSINEVALLEKRLQGIAWPYLKKDCLDLPEKQYREITLKPSKTIQRVAEQLAEIAPSPIQALTWLRELSDGFQYVEKQVGTEPCECTRGLTVPPVTDCDLCNGEGVVPIMERHTKMVACPKDQAIKDLLDENADQGRLIIFAGFQGSIDRVRQICLDQKWDVVQVDGRGWKVFADTDLKPIKYWRSDAERVVYLAHPESGGTGLTLTEARMAVYYSNDFKPENRLQSEDRGHRPGMDLNKGFTIVDLFHLSTDRRVRDVLKANRRLELMTLGEVRDAL